MVNHGGLWIPRQQFESATGYFFLYCFVFILFRVLLYGMKVIRAPSLGRAHELVVRYGMKVIRAPSLGRAHELVVRYILQEGSFLRTENGEDTVETDEVCLNLLFGSDAVFEYDYHGRLFDWGCGLCDASGEVHCDQVRYIVEKLRASPESRRAVGVTWCPPVDGKLGDCPCLQLIQCVVRDGRLDMKVVFRSNDMLSAAGANMFALARLQEFVAKEVGAAVGAYTHVSLVPHIYFKRDAADRCGGYSSVLSGGAGVYAERGCVPGVRQVRAFPQIIFLFFEKSGGFWFEVVVFIHPDGMSRGRHGELCPIYVRQGCV